MTFHRRDVATIQFFNTLIENILQGLSPSETKVLLLVARQTMGWTDGKGGYKAQDWMTNKYLQERCNLSHTSVSSAIESLVKKKLIIVKDEAGQTLQSPAERRRCSRLLFSLVTSRSVQEQAGAQDLPNTQDGIPKIGKLERQVPRYVPQNEEVCTEESQPLRMQKSRMVKAVEGSPPVRDLPAMQSSGKPSVNNQPDKPINLHPMQNIGFQKLETTKSDKYINKNINNRFVVSKNLNALHEPDTHHEVSGPMQSFGNVEEQVLLEESPLQIEHLEVLKAEETFGDPQNDDVHYENIQNAEVSDGSHFEEPSHETSKATQPSLSNEAKQVLAAYRRQFREHVSDKAIPKATPSDFEKLESYFEKHTPQVLISLLPTFFTVDYDFNSRNEYSLHTFVHSVNILLYGLRRIQHLAQEKHSIQK